MNDVREIPLNLGHVALVDANDYDDVAQFNWFVTARRPYASRSYRKNGKMLNEKMHRRLLPGAMVVDHINGNGLDNRRSNLRAVTWLENSRNRSKLQVNNKSGFRGVHRHSQGKWCAQISLAGRRKHLGLFATPEEAARAWDLAAIHYYGEYAGRLNFPEVA